MSTPVLIGFDLETTGSNWREHQPIEIGLILTVDHLDHVFEARIRPNYSKAKWSDEAEKVHRISRTDLADEAPIELVDGAAAYWLHTQLQGVKRIERWAVGWNVASFDLAMIDAWMPLTRKQLSYRSLDLNAAVLTIAEILARDPGSYKQELKERAAAGKETAWHSALFDADMGLRAYRLAVQDVLDTGGI